MATLCQPIVNAAAGLVTRRFIDRQRPSDPWQNGATRRGTSTHSAQGRSSSQTMARCGVTRSAYASRFARAIDPRPSRPCFASQRSIESGFQARFLRLLCAGYRMPWSPGSTRPVSVSRLAASFESVTFELKHAREPSVRCAAMVRQ